MAGMKVLTNTDLPVTPSTGSRNLSSMREMAIALLRARPPTRLCPLKQQRATLDPDFRLKLLENFHAYALAGPGLGRETS